MGYEVLGVTNEGALKPGRWMVSTPAAHQPGDDIVVCVCRG